ncbi:hypothetical protein NIES4101_84190 [Calothrix sp. NIES-4101]|nr:hypothetical protein NIES4101_84190 [Calothrix sp. NIES-4101]
MNEKATSTSDFKILDEIIAQSSIQPLSLSPDRDLITSFQEIGNLVSEKTCNQQIIDCLYHTIEIILSAQLENFPENIFWDFDLMVLHMLEQSLSAEDGAIVFLDSFGQKIVDLMNIFGCRGKIRFRYVHDFMYGFDWARWVKKDPENRSHVQPFNPIFLDYLLAKGEEILNLVRVEDKRYHHISRGRFRNSFCFPRNPEDEYRLLTYLADSNMIPVAAWNWNTYPIWDKPFDEMREQAALAIRNS